VADSGIYDRVMNADGDSATPSADDRSLRRQIEELETELDRYRDQEKLIADTLSLATRHAAAIRENARRDAELTLRKARIEAAERKGTAELDRDHTLAELLRLRRITERMRSSLSTFLASTVDELRREGVEGEQVSNQTTALEAALATVVESSRRTEVRDRVEDGPIGGSRHELS
jgi:cell division septum initiation protein DivIVA